MKLPSQIAIGADHAGFDLKKVVIEYLESLSITVHDYGTHSADSVDYADFAHPVASAIDNSTFEMGILICGSANGIAIAANKHQKIRAAIAWKEELAALARQHNDANILCLPARFITDEEALSCVKAFLNTAFEGGRHARRVSKIPC